jgi:hypothetical protein
MSITPSTNLRMQLNRSGRKPRENNMRNCFSTRVPVSSSIQASGNSEQWKMTGQADNVGFLATESGVQQFQLSLGGCFVLKGAPHNTGGNRSYGMNRGPGGNVGRTRGLFATMLARADTKEAIGLNRSRLPATRPVKWLTLLFITSQLCHWSVPS